MHFCPFAFCGSFYRAPVTGKHFDFEWEAAVYSRDSGIGCPFLSNKSVWVGFNDLETVNPELAKEWHPAKNGNLTPQNVTRNSDKKVWWILPYDDIITGKHYDFEWKAKIDNRARGKGCPYLSFKGVWPGFNDLTTENPELAEEWNQEKNIGLNITNMKSTTRRKVWWKCKECDFEWRSSILLRTRGQGCPECLKNHRNTI